ncbi:MAG: hypothetical protein ACPLZB_04980 [Caldisericaceae bacterium]
MEKLIRMVYSNCTIGHYELPLNNVNDYKPRGSFEHRIISNYFDLPYEFLERMERDSLISSRSIKIALYSGDMLVISYLDKSPASYCFFAVNPRDFAFFSLKAKEIYFFNCFTFLEARGKAAIYSEVKYVIEAYKGLGYSKANVEIFDNNKNSIRAFEKLGFKKTLEHNVTRVLFIKRIKEKFIS